MLKVGMNPRRPGTAARTIFKNYQSGAKKRNLSFEITIKEFLYFASLPCFYCGAVLTNKWTSRSGEEYRYNGIDRVDTLEGYVKTNCVACCKWCNRAKSDLTSEQFVENCKRVAGHS